MSFNSIGKNFILKVRLEKKKNLRLKKVPTTIGKADVVPASDLQPS